MESQVLCHSLQNLQRFQHQIKSFLQSIFLTKYMPLET
nr:MAG TPA: hypothetical protein [Bacteriophage sp.]